MNTLRSLIIESLMEDVATGACEWQTELSIWNEQTGELTFPEGLPMLGDFIEYKKVPREFIEQQSDEMLLRLYTANCCLAFR